MFNHLLTYLKIKRIKVLYARFLVEVDKWSKTKLMYVLGKWYKIV
jgi:hypothetical protein